MIDEKFVEQWLLERGFTIAKSVIKGEVSNAEFYAFVKIDLSNEGKRTPTNFTLGKISKEALDLGFHLSFVLVNDDADDIDGSIKAMLARRYPELIRNSFCSLPDHRAHIWIDQRRDITQKEKEDIEKDITILLNLFNVCENLVTYSGEVSTPTPTAILRTIRLISPCTLDGIGLNLTSKGFTIPSIVWLNHAIDRLRKSELILRKGNEEYVLTLKGLSALGTEKNRRSPDIVRALALARARA